MRNYYTHFCSFAHWPLVTPLHWFAANSLCGGSAFGSPEADIQAAKEAVQLAQMDGNYKAPYVCTADFSSKIFPSPH